MLLAKKKRRLNNENIFLKHANIARETMTPQYSTENVYVSKSTEHRYTYFTVQLQSLFMKLISDPGPSLCRPGRSTPLQVDWRKST